MPTLDRFSHAGWFSSGFPVNRGNHSEFFVLAVLSRANTKIGSGSRILTDDLVVMSHAS